ncbi:globin domain-containing protein [Tuberibacillus sp. Marseille-P3662]|uniref:globin domain-containing protein n=1 Tax=Tuberibacillus sp. Marseille-P3662 TaxID=1965358 RepID=UPI000A1CA3B1|nr:globin [Tuberibacillus sp. Marseille-P3662]
MEYPDQTIYEGIGGADKVAALVDHFYDRVARHPDLAPIFPDDLTETKRKQQQFLTQFLGGPSLYSEEHGHPRLRARHLRFPIGAAQGRAWLSCMQAAMDAVTIPEPWCEIMFERLTLTAHHMVNLHEENSLER